MAVIINTCRIEKTGTDGTDFSTNYKSLADEIDRELGGMASSSKIINYDELKSIVDGTYVKWTDVHYWEEDDYYNLSVYTGMCQVVASSRPQGTNPTFTTAGDVSTKIGGGDRLEWDFSNTDNDVTAPTGYKKKQIDISFIDEVWLKEGTIYFYNCPKGCELNLSILVPSGEYYYDNNGDLVQATSDTTYYTYVNRHPAQGSAPMGDELNTEAATINSLPTNYRYRLEILTPDTDSESNGVVELEIYRKRTQIL